MENAIIFRFYKEPEICLNRLQLLRKQNPKIKIFGLYWWEQGQSNIYKKMLGKFLDDFYVSPYKDSYRKRENWDLVLTDWYKERGKKLKRKSVYILQRDMLVFAPLQDIFNDYKSGQFYISWIKVLDKNIEKRRSRTSKNGRKQNYEKFKELIMRNYGYKKRLLCSLFIFAILPRKFFEQYTKLVDNTTWFLEYKLPSYAKIFWLDFYKKDIWVRRFQPKWKCPQNARVEEISKEYILNELDKKKWWRMFHPYFKIR